MQLSSGKMVCDEIQSLFVNAGGHQHTVCIVSIVTSLHMAKLLLLPADLVAFSIQAIQFISNSIIFGRMN